MFTFVLHAAESGSVWPAVIKDWVAPAPGEHPRLFFRKGDLPDLRKRAETAEGKAILARLRFLLNGSDGESMPEVFNTATDGYQQDGTKFPPGKTFTLWHGVGYGMLYQLTQDKKYAALGRQCVQKALDGQRDKDDRYSFVKPPEFLRAGPAVGAIAMAYDLCYDGWDDDFRKTVAIALQDYSHKATKPGKGDGQITLERMALSPFMKPGSNHYAPQVGGAGLAVLALKGDPGVDDAKLAKFLEGVEKQIVKVLTEGFGERGYFHEHPGPGQIASDTAFVPMLQAMKNAGGKDYTANRPNAKWLALRWPMWLLSQGGKPIYPNPHPDGSYGTEYFSRAPTISRSGQFAQGFGLLSESEKSAMLWSYKTFVEPEEEKAYAQFLNGAASFDAIEYPHRAVLALVNWPIGVVPQNPEMVLPKAVGDSIMGHYVMRNRWKDENDIIVSVLIGARPDKGGQSVQIWGMGQRATLGGFPKAKASFWQPQNDGSAVLTAAGTSIGVDYSKASGAEALVVMSGPGAKAGTSTGKIKAKSFTVGDTTFHLLILGDAAEPKMEGDKLTIGAQSISISGGNIMFGKTATTPDVPK